MGKEEKKGGKKEENEILVDGRNNFSILHHAIQNTNWEEDPVVVQELIKTGEFKVTDADKQGNTCLHLAAQFDRQDDHVLLETFLYRSQDYISQEDLERCIATKNDVGMTPLHLACRFGNISLVGTSPQISSDSDSNGDDDKSNIGISGYYRLVNSNHWTSEKMRVLYVSEPIKGNIQKFCVNRPCGEHTHVPGH